GDCALRVSTLTRSIKTSAITSSSLLLIYMLDSFSQSFSRTQRTPELFRLDTCRALAISRDCERGAYCLVIRIAQFHQAVGRRRQVRFGNDFLGCRTRPIEDWPQLLS